MECRNCELRQKQFFCRTCVKTHIRDYQSQHAHYLSDLSNVIASASTSLSHIVQPARIARAQVADAKARIEELAVGLGAVRKECEKKRDKIRRLREDLAQRRRTLGAAKILVKSSPTTTMTGPTTFPSTLKADSQTPHLPPSPAHLDLTQTLARARSGLVQELVDVFNIVEVGGRPPVGGKAGTKGEWTIGGLVLPVPGDIRRYPPDHINAVLTLTIHFISLLSFYLGVKLPFEVTWTGGKLGLGQPMIGAIRGGSTGGGDGGWGRWYKKHPLHLTGQAKSAESREPSKPTASDNEDTTKRSPSNSSSSDDDDPMASSVLTIRGPQAKKSLPPINTSLANPSKAPATPLKSADRHTASPQARAASNPESNSPYSGQHTLSSTSSRPGPTPLVSSPLSNPRKTTLSFSSALGAVRKGVGGVVSAGVGVVGYGAATPGSKTSPQIPTAEQKPAPNTLEESAFIVKSPTSLTSTSVSSRSPPAKLPQQKSPSTPAHLSPSSAPPSFTTGYTMLIYNVCYLAHTQKVVPEIGLSQAGEVLSNLWKCCCSSELGKVGHESAGWAATSSSTWGIPGSFNPVDDPMSGAGLTLVRLPPPTPPTFSMDFGQLLQAVSGAGGGARAKTKVAKAYSENRTLKGSLSEEAEEEWVDREEVENEARERDDWDIVEGDVSL